MDISKEAFQVSLVFACGLVLGFFECGVANVDLAVLAPVFWLFRVSVYFKTRYNVSKRTVDFQYSAILYYISEDLLYVMW